MRKEEKEEEEEEEEGYPMRALLRVCLPRLVAIWFTQAAKRNKIVSGFTFVLVTTGDDWEKN